MSDAPVPPAARPLGLVGPGGSPHVGEVRWNRDLPERWYGEIFVSPTGREPCCSGPGHQTLQEAAECVQRAADERGGA